MSDKQPGYVLHADPLWLAHHRRFSAGGRIAYCRGSGAPMHNVTVGGMLFFLPTLDPPKRVVGCAAFTHFEVLPVDEAWDRYGLALGATSFQAWQELAERIESVRNRREIGLIVGDNFRLYPQPLVLAEVGVAEVNNAPKGWSIGSADVERLVPTVAQG